jgi:predicted TPR repeat methyltransferase
MNKVSIPLIEIDKLVSLYSQGKFKEAIERIQFLNKDYPNLPIIFNILGACHKKLGNLNVAAKIFENAISLKSDYAEAHFNLGITLNEIGKIKNALDSYKRAIAILPDYVEAHNNLGNIFKKIEQNDDAIRCFEKVISINPKYAEAHYNLGSLYRKLEKFDDAIKSFELALAINPNYDEAKHLLNVLIGHTSNTPPKKYVEKLFDDFADRFEDSLVNNLHYNLPFQIKDLILKFNNKDTKFKNVIDLGCGTGLAGQHLREISINLKGIDISKNMISKAEMLGIYDKLIIGEIVEELSSLEEKFDLFVALDVLIYIGDIQSIFNIVSKRSDKEALFIFSVEIKDGEGFSLLKSARYGHSEKYIMEQASGIFELVHSINVRLRKEGNDWINGKVYSFRII